MSSGQNLECGLSRPEPRRVKLYTLLTTDSVLQSYGHLGDGTVAFLGVGCKSFRRDAKRERRTADVDAPSPFDR